MNLYFQFMLDRMPLSKSERLSVGTLDGVAFSRTLCKDDTSCAGSNSASERSSIAERGKVQGFNCMILCKSIKTFPSNPCFIAEKL